MRKVEPNFIGIGVQKGGTSWLYKQLLQHPEIFVPEHRKEIHFFDEYYDRKMEWYIKWFRNADRKAIGEITPNYIYDENVPKKIHESFPDIKFIVMLRHPVERAFSHYQMIFQSGEGQKYEGFDDFMARHPHGKKRGFYGKQLQRWFQFFKPEQFLILVSDEIFANENGIDDCFKNVSDFLNVDPELFDKDLAQNPVGKARTVPANNHLAKLAQKTRIFLRDNDLDFIASGLKKAGLTRQLFSKKTSKVNPLTPEQKNRWVKEYQEDIRLLESLLGRSFPNWS